MIITKANNPCPIKLIIGKKAAINNPIPPVMPKIRAICHCSILINYQCGIIDLLGLWDVFIANNDGLSIFDEICL